MNEIVKYETSFGEIELSPEIVKKYLSKGQSFTDQEIHLFIKLCQAHKLNPFINEAYLIKYGSECQIVIGYDTYKRRAEENPSYLRRESGIVVQRGEEIKAKQGYCLYPTEKLIGGWCKVFYLRNKKEQSEYVEVSLAEYMQRKQDGTPNRTWAGKPATMIHKVAIAQALKGAFPRDYEGMYIQEEADSIQPIDEITEIATKEQRQEVMQAIIENYSDANSKDINSILDDALKLVGVENIMKASKEQCELMVTCINNDLQLPEENPTVEGFVVESEPVEEEPPKAPVLKVVETPPPATKSQGVTTELATQKELDKFYELAKMKGMLANGGAGLKEFLAQAKAQGVTTHLYLQDTDKSILVGKTELQELTKICRIK